MQRDLQRQHEQRQQRQLKQQAALEAQQQKKTAKRYGMTADFNAQLSALNSRVADRWDSRLDFLEKLGEAEKRDNMARNALGQRHAMP